MRTKAELALERTWVVWHNARARAPARRAGRGGAPAEAVYTDPETHGSFGTIRTMWEWMNNLPAPSKLRQDVNLFIFQQGVDPVWEHPANCKGGRWTFTYAHGEPAEADQAWQDTYLSLVGEVLEASTGVTGITATRRQHYVRLAVWTRDREDELAVLAIGRSLKDMIAAKLEYQDHGGGTRHTLA